MDSIEAEKLAQQMLSPKRFAHVQGVVAAATRLAEKYGVDVQKAVLAAWLHDIVKEYDKNALLQLMRQDGIISTSLLTRPFAVWHGPCAAVYARTVLGVQDEEVLSAVACHTTGRVGMSDLDKVLYLADGISAERNYAGVEELRRLAKTDLNAAVMKAMRDGIQRLQQKGREVDGQSLEALRDLSNRYPQ